MAPHSSTLAWKIAWTEEPGGLQSMGSRLGGIGDRRRRGRQRMRWLDGITDSMDVQSTCPELSAQGLVPLRWGCAPSPCAWRPDFPGTAREAP